MRTVISIVALLSLTLTSSVHADWVSVLPGSMDQVVANAGFAVARRNAEVWLVRDDGSVVGHLAGRDRDGSRPERLGGTRESEEILDFFDIAESDRHEDWAQDLVYDERTLAQRKRARAASALPSQPPSPPPALTAGAGNIWIGTGHGLLRITPLGDVTSVRTRESLGSALLAVGSRVAVGQPDGYQVYSSAGDREDTLPLSVHDERVAASASGQRWARANGAAIEWTGVGDEPHRFAAGSPVVDLRYCGETLVILLPDSLVAVAPGGAPEVRSRDLVATHVLCPEGEAAPWLASGRALFLSFDQGRRWRTVETPAGITIAAVAATAHHLWLATPQGLFFSTDGDSAELSARPEASMEAPRPRRRRRHGSWLSWLPKVSIRATAVVAPTGQEMEALAYATIPLDPQRLPFTATAVEDLSLSGAAGPPPRAAEAVVDTRDPDRHCLAPARRRAVELAMAEPERARSYVSRAGHAAWLPELRLLVSRRYGRSESLDIAASSTALSSPLGIDTVNDIRYEARATWDLAKLVFSTEELAAQNQALHMAEVRREIESAMNRLYHERRRLVIEHGPTDGWARRLRSNEIDAELDGLSGGAFGACVRGEDSQGRR